MFKIKNYSPLRYPGGKSGLTNFISDLAGLNNLKGGTYLELYAGGAGAALNLLFSGVFDKVHINDYDTRIYAMWSSVLEQPDNFCELIYNTPVSIDEWYTQKKIFNNYDTSDLLSLGFATFYLNRTNRSGIIFNAGPIGGFNQKGNYKINARYNKTKLIERIKLIAEKKSQIVISNLDALTILPDLNRIFNDTENLFIYMDPPYYLKGAKLYMNNYIHSDHIRFAKEVSKLNSKISWLISYDNVKEIKDMYKNFRMSTFSLGYSLQDKKHAKELLIFSDTLNLSNKITVNNKHQDLKIISHND